MPINILTTAEQTQVNSVDSVSFLRLVELFEIQPVSYVLYQKMWSQTSTANYRERTTSQKY